MPLRKEAFGGTSAARRYVGGVFSGSYRWPPVGVAERRAAVTALPVPVACPPHPRADVAPQRLDELLRRHGPVDSTARLATEAGEVLLRDVRVVDRQERDGPDDLGGVPAEEPVEGVDVGVGFLLRGRSPSVVVAVGFVV